MGTLRDELLALGRPTFDLVARELDLHHEIAAPGEPHVRRVHDLLEAAMRHGVYADLEAAVADLRATSAHLVDAMHPEHRHRPFVRALEVGEPNPAKLPAVLVELGIEWPSGATTWAEVVLQTDEAGRRALAEWAMPTAGLDTEERCLDRIVVALLASDLDRARLLQLAVMAGVEAAYDDTPLDVWVEDLARQASTTWALGRWLTLVAADEPSLLTLCRRWTALAETRDATVRAKVEALAGASSPELGAWLRSPDEGPPPALAGERVAVHLRALMEQLEAARADVEGPPWRWRRGARLATVLLHKLETLPGQEEQDPEGRAYEAGQILDAYRTRVRALRGAAGVAGWGRSRRWFRCPWLVCCP